MSRSSSEPGASAPMAHAAEAKGAPVSGDREGLPSPYEAPELYDLVLERFAEDLPFWLDEAKRANGPVLEVGCGTGRVLLALLEAGADADGVDLYPKMLDRLRANAAAKKLQPRLVQADMRDFTMPRRYRRVFIPFNGFAHCATTEDQIRCLKCCREHLEPGGALVLHISYPGVDYWSGPEGERVLEVETPHPVTGHPVCMYDTRTRNRVDQFQDSATDIEELGPDGTVARVHRFQTSQRWVYRFELELLFRCAGFSRWEILGGWDPKPLDRDTDQMMGFAWKD